MMAHTSAHFLVRDEAMAEAFQLFLATFQSLTSEAPLFWTAFLPNSTLNWPAKGTQQKKWAPAVF